jgi:hypothetical protein
MTDFDPKAAMLDIQGKAYLPVAARVFWARGEHPDWSIVTEAVMVSDGPFMLATVRDGGGRVLATAHKSINPHRTGPGAKYPVESAETGAIGRALGLCGYGTMAGDLDEGDEIADSPIDRPATAQAPKPATKPATRARKAHAEQQPQDHVYTPVPEAAVDLPWPDNATALPGGPDSWAVVIDECDKPADLVALLSRIEDEADPYRRAGSLRLWAHKMADIGDVRTLREVGAAVKAWPRGSDSRAEVLEILVPAYKALAAGEVPA